ncbi:MAG: AzlD domain-containing protein [Thermoflavifilum sp.]|nr:AzlD domain-containing protein [Thermoflavifilum sp.]MCL6514988.1 AzlD domain-containing protein [Alicyclobacillus sp.]
MESTLWIETLCIGIGTYLMRSVSLTLGSRLRWPEGVRRWLSFVTPAVLGALIGQAVLLQGNQLVPPLHNPALWATLPTVAIAWWSRHLLATVAVGVACFAIASAIAPAA